MSKMDDYRIAKQEHEFLCGILKKSAEQGNSQHIHYSKLDDVYHVVAFSFCSKSGGSHKYQKSERLADFIGKACDHLKSQILEMELPKKLELVSSNEVRTIVSTPEYGILTDSEFREIIRCCKAYEGLVEALSEIEAVSCGEKQVADDDSEGMGWIYKRIQALQETEQ